jgi:hypothetical protein
MRLLSDISFSTARSSLEAHDEFAKPVAELMQWVEAYKISVGTVRAVGQPWKLSFRTIPVP